MSNGESRITRIISDDLAGTLSSDAQDLVAPFVRHQLSEADAEIAEAEYRWSYRRSGSAT